MTRIWTPSSLVRTFYVFVTPPTPCLYTSNIQNPISLPLPSNLHPSQKQQKFITAYPRMRVVLIIKISIE